VSLSYVFRIYAVNPDPAGREPIGVDYQEDATIRVAGVHNVDASWFLL
jgi:hypothetical protein